MSQETLLFKETTARTIIADPDLLSSLKQVDVENAHNQPTEPAPKHKARHPEDFYREEPWAVEAVIHTLLGQKIAFGDILDPSCGKGHIPDICRSLGLTGRGSDLIDRADGRFSQQDFIATPISIPCCDTIFSNPPPYVVTMRWLEQAFRAARHRVIILERLAFGFDGIKRQEAIDDFPLVYGWGLKYHVGHRIRVNMPPGDDPVIKRTGTSQLHAWYVFERDYTGLSMRLPSLEPGPQFHRINREWVRIEPLPHP